MGMWDALEQTEENHVVVFTDADLSTHLGQLGLVTHPILAKGKVAAIGSRRERQSVVVKGAGRNQRGEINASEMVDDQRNPNCADPIRDLNQF